MEAFVYLLGKPRNKHTVSLRVDSTLQVASPLRRRTVHDSCHSRETDSVQRLTGRHEQRQKIGDCGRPSKSHITKTFSAAELTSDDRNLTIDRVRTWKLFDTSMSSVCKQLRTIQAQDCQDKTRELRRARKVSRAEKAGCQGNRALTLPQSVQHVVHGHPVPAKYAIRRKKS